MADCGDVHSIACIAIRLQLIAQSRRPAPSNPAGRTAGEDQADPQRVARHLWLAADFARTPEGGRSGESQNSGGIDEKKRHQSKAEKEIQGDDELKPQPAGR